MTTIENPWIIVHQPGGQGAPIETILAGPGSAGPAHWSLAIADVIRHTANAFGLDEADILETIESEIRNPTTDIKRTGPN